MRYYPRELVGIEIWAHVRALYLFERFRYAVIRDYPGRLMLSFSDATLLGLRRCRFQVLWSCCF